MKGSVSKQGDMNSKAEQIGRGLDHLDCFFRFHFVQFSGYMPCTQELFAPLAQLVEHLTLNQGVQGSSP